MTSRWMLFVSRRHFRTKRREKGHTAGVLSVVGIAAGALTLITVLSVMNGFQSGTINDILEINSYHLQVTGPDPFSTTAAISELPGVRSATPFVDVFGLASGYFPDPLAVVLRAVPPGALTQDLELGRALRLAVGSLDLGAFGTVVLGEELARRLGVRVGDTIQMVNFAGAGNLIAPDTGALLITGIYKSGFLEYDAGWGFVSLETATGRLSTDATPAVGVKLTDRFADRAVAAKITAMPAVESVVSWRTYNRAIFGALRLEKTLMMLLVGLIFVVVGVNIYQSLRRSVVERTEEVGVLKAIGASPSALRLVFVLEGLWIGLAGATTGTMLGLLISFNINQVFSLAEAVINGGIAVADWIVGVLMPGQGSTVGGGFAIFSPAYFYLDEVPAQVMFGEVLGVFLFAVLSAAVAAYFASRRVSGIRPAEVLRYE
ncbi:MAG: ABC transporter permease [Spirochaetales bacterium]|nr:MAG: ABC transporter permease [Spirochaetales bacterium]